MNPSNKIHNQETKVPKTPQMNERDFINDMLTTEKYLAQSYNTALNEASHNDLYEELLSIYTETQNTQRSLYELMFQKGWYSLESQDPSKLQKAYDQFQGYKNQFPYQNNVQ